MPEIVKTPDVLGGDTPEEIATSYEITVTEVHAALAYAFSNPDEMRDIEARREAAASDHAANRLVPGESE